jgi:hypothetical protein
MYGVARLNHQWTLTRDTSRQLIFALVFVALALSFRFRPI